MCLSTSSNGRVPKSWTAVLIGHFFEVIAEAERVGETVDYARALRDAKPRVRTDADNPRWADPYYWAAFTITGQR